MRKLIASTFVSLDGVMQAPGGPEEDPTGGFELGGWTFPFFDESLDISGAGFDGSDRELVLGRRTYEIFDAYWPYQSDDTPPAATLNAAKKYVASRTLTELHWNNSVLLEGDAAVAVAALKSQPGPNLQIIGSGNLIHSLQAADLIDEYNICTFPVVLGKGKRLFENPTAPGAFRLASSQVSTTGVILNRYVREGEVPTGTFATIEPSEKELARRERMVRDDW